MDNIKHNSIIVPYLSANLFKNEFYFHYTDLCVYLEDKNFNSVSDIHYYTKEKNQYKKWKFIKSSELIGYNIYECW